MPFLRRIAPALGIALLFVAAGLAFIRKAGMHVDASYEIGSIYACAGPVYTATLFGHTVPIMVIPYLGALKAWLYLPVLTYFEVTPFTMRLPLLLVAGGSVWLAFALLERISGRRAAVAGALLLATDSVFVIVSTYDFGPVVLLHFFLLAGLLLLLRFDRTRSLIWLCLACFLFGLALWHKALFVWMLSGLVAGGLAAVPGRIRAALSVKAVTAAAASFCLGALPLLWYNAATSGATAHTAAVVSAAAPLSQKLLILRRSLDGTVLEGFLTEEDRPQTTKSPRTTAGKAAAALSRLTDGFRIHLILAAFLLSLAAVPWLWSTPARRPAVFVVVYMAVAWFEMTLLPGTGGSVHHAILLWPFPHFLIAIALAQVSFKMGSRGPELAACVLTVLAASNLLLMNHYYTDLVTKGTTALWTEATFPLNTYLSGLRERRVIATDWGYAATLCLFSDGEAPAVDLSGVLKNPSPDERAWVESLIADPRNVFVGHPPEDEMFTGVNGRLAAIAAARGYRSEIMHVVTDSNGRPRFQVLRFVADGR